LENRIAEFINQGPGDVLIYAPGKKMNEKVAKMKVLSSGVVKTLDEVNDPIVKDHLELTKRAHKALWAIQLFAVKGLKKEAKRDAIELFEAELLCGQEKREERLKEIQMRKIRHDFKKRGNQPQMELAEFEEKLRNVRERVFWAVSPEDLKKPLRQRLNGAFDAEFGLESAPSEIINPRHDLEESIRISEFEYNKQRDEFRGQDAELLRDLMSEARNAGGARISGPRGRALCALVVTTAWKIQKSRPDDTAKPKAARHDDPKGLVADALKQLGKQFGRDIFSAVP
jgi:hypothetical protein